MLAAQDARDGVDTSSTPQPAAIEKASETIAQRARSIVEIDAPISDLDDEVKLEYPSEADELSLLAKDPIPNVESCVRCSEEGIPCIGGAKKRRRCSGCKETKSHCSFSRVNNKQPPKRKVEELQDITDIGGINDNDEVRELLFPPQSSVSSSSKRARIPRKPPLPIIHIPVPERLRKWKSSHFQEPPGAPEQSTQPTTGSSMLPPPSPLNLPLSTASNLGTPRSTFPSHYTYIPPTSPLQPGITTSQASTCTSTNNPGKARTPSFCYEWDHATNSVKHLKQSKYYQDSVFLEYYTSSTSAATAAVKYSNGLPVSSSDTDRHIDVEVMPLPTTEDDETGLSKTFIVVVNSSGENNQGESSQTANTLQAALHTSNLTSASRTSRRLTQCSSSESLGSYSKTEMMRLSQALGQAADEINIFVARNMVDIETLARVKKFVDELSKERFHVAKKVVDIELGARPKCGKRLFEKQKSGDRPDASIVDDGKGIEPSMPTLT